MLSFRVARDPNGISAGHAPDNRAMGKREASPDKGI